MKNFKLENITIEISTHEALLLKNALEWYRASRIDRIQVWTESDDEWLLKNFGIAHEDMNIREHKRLEKDCIEMEKILMDAYNGYPFKI